ADLSGRYAVPAAAGTAQVRASVPQTALQASGSVTVSAGASASLDLVLAGAVLAATVDPPDGALGVSLTAGITVSSPEPFNPATVSAANVQLARVTAGGELPVPLRFVLAQGGRQLSVFPLANLLPVTRYRFQASGLAS